MSDCTAWVTSRDAASFTMLSCLIVGKDCWEGRGPIGPRERELYGHVCWTAEMFKLDSPGNRGWRPEVKEKLQKEEMCKGEGPQRDFCFLLWGEVHSEVFFYSCAEPRQQRDPRVQTHKATRLGWWWHGRMLHPQLDHGSGWLQADQARQAGKKRGSSHALC